MQPLTSIAVLAIIIGFNINNINNNDTNNEQLFVVIDLCWHNHWLDVSR